jgi:hypothetical protein
VKIVSNASPLIILARIGHLESLRPTSGRSHLDRGLLRNPEQRTPGAAGCFSFRAAVRLFGDNVEKPPNNGRPARLVASRFVAPCACSAKRNRHSGDRKAQSFRGVHGGLDSSVPGKRHSSSWQDDQFGPEAVKRFSNAMKHVLSVPREVVQKKIEDHRKE